MPNRLTQLSFVIGLFFSLVSIILFVNMFLNNAINGLNLFTSISFLVFGVGMMMVKNRKTES